MSERVNNLPPHVRIGPYTYRVSRPEHCYNDDGTQKLWGHIAHSPEQHITIWRDAPDDRAWDTLIHESLHAINDLATLELTEEQIARIATAFFAFLRDNSFQFPTS